ncbi:hypothetical protein EJB05_37144, partial [Eragrostis curvula]
MMQETEWKPDPSACALLTSHGFDSGGTVGEALPYPSQGHATPMPKLAKLLHPQGFHITFVNTEHNHRRLLHSGDTAVLEGVAGFRFASMPDGLPQLDAEATQIVSALCFFNMTSSLSSPATTTTGAPPVTCLIVDAMMPFAYDAATAIGVPCAALWTATTTTPTSPTEA